MMVLLIPMTPANIAHASERPLFYSGQNVFILSSSRLMLLLFLHIDSQAFR